MHAARRAVHPALAVLHHLLRAVDDGLLHVVLIEELKMLNVLSLLPRLTMRGELRTDRVKRWQVERLTLSADRPCLFHGDGEILGPAPVLIELVRGALQILSPR